MAQGDITSEEAPLSLSKLAFDGVSKAVWNQEDVRRTAQSRFPHVSTDLHYDENDQPDFLTFSFRCPRRCRSLVGVIRINLAQNLAASVGLSLNCSGDAAMVRKKCIDHAAELSRHPLYLTKVLFESCFDNWSEWFARVCQAVVEVETATEMSAREWMLEKLPLPRQAELARQDSLLKTLHGANVELSHVRNVMTSAHDFGRECTRAIELLESALRDVGREDARMTKRDRVELTREINFVSQRCTQVDRRALELTRRLEGQINVVFSLIAQRNSEGQAPIADQQRVIADEQRLIARVTAEDSRTMRSIAVLTLLFLPPTFVTGVWSANVIHLDASQSWIVWLSTIIAVTRALIAAWHWYYRRLERAGRGT